MSKDNKQNIMEIKQITLQSKEFKIVEAIYDEAFPNSEKMGTMETLVKYSKEHDNSLQINAICKDETVVGLYVVLQKPEFVILLFFAVNSKLRGGGYGSKIIKQILDKHNDKLLIGTIESPIESASNYEQRIKRKRFYDRNGMPMIDNHITINGNDLNFIISNPETDIVDLMRPLELYMSELINGLQSM